jgi:hypothetical protein
MSISFGDDIQQSRSKSLCRLKHIVILEVNTVYIFVSMATNSYFVSSKFMVDGKNLIVRWKQSSRHLKMFTL